MSEVLPALLDALLAAAFGFGGFRLVNLATSFGPIVALGALVGVSVYYGLGYVMWRASPAQHFLGRRQDR